MIIAIDYDDTYTKDICGWNIFILMMQRRGHIFYCVTNRKQDNIKVIHRTIGEIIQEKNCIATDGASKRKFLRDLNIMPDVWIDDAPETIVDIKLLDGLTGQ